MKDYAVQIKVKNNWLLTRMRAAGFENANQLARASGVHQTIIGEFLNLTRAPMATKTQQWRAPVLHLAEFLRCLPEDLFPPQHIGEPLKRNTAELKLAAEEIPLLIGAWKQEAETPLLAMERDESLQAIENALGELSPRCELVLRLRYGLDTEAEPMTLDKIGERLGVSVERVRQMEASGLRRLKHPSRSRALHEAHATVCGGDLRWQRS